MSDGLITVESRFPVSETIDRLAAAATAAGLLVFARIDHQKGALDAGLHLRPTELLLFGHPRGGTPLMQESQPAGIDLPFKALAWQDEHGRVWLTWNDAQWLAQRHRLSAASASAVQAIRSGADSLAAAATEALLRLGRRYAGPWHTTQRPTATGVRAVAELIASIAVGRPIGYLCVDIDADAQERELLADIDRDRGDALLVQSWIPDTPPGWG